MIELLVVIAIIASLAAILMPVLDKALARADRAACMSNLRQCGLALTMYLDDNRVFPLAKIANGTPGAPSGYNEDDPSWSALTVFHAAGQGDDVWYNALSSYAGGVPLWQIAQANGTTNFMSARKIFDCGTAQQLPSDFASNPDRIVFNYGMNYKGNYGLTGVGYGTNFTGTMVMHPSAFVFLSDVRAHASERPFYGSNPGNEVGCSHCWAAQISSRHNAGANITFADAHVAWFKYSYICSNGVTSAGDASDPDINWTYNGAGIP